MSYDFWIYQGYNTFLLKGHQIIGELRLLQLLLLQPVQPLKGHQIIGELRLNTFCSKRIIIIERSPDHWWVTTKDTPLSSLSTKIERSPDHWWVTTCISSCCYNFSYWKVTRSLVSYDCSIQEDFACSLILKGHQIIGELRPTLPTVGVVTVALKGHQIIGELRHVYK